jgi:hypothetical protein
MQMFDTAPAPWGDSRPHLRIANKFAKGNQYDDNILEMLSFDNAERGLSLRVFEGLSRRKFQLQCDHLKSSIKNHIMLIGEKR